MATLKAKRTVHGAVPAELQDVNAAAWHDPRAFSGWCARQGVHEPPNVPTWPQKFQGGLRLWADLHNVTGLHDRERLKDLKIPFVGSLERAKARCEMDRRP